MAFLKTFKNLVYPVTLLTVITFLSIAICIEAIYIGFTHESPAIIYAVVAIPATAFIIGLYVIDRVLVKKIAYYKLLLSELGIVVAIAIGGYLLNSYSNGYIDVLVSTPDDYILVIFDADENSLDRFSKKGFFGKELLLEDSNIVHLDKSMASKKDLRIKPSESWMGTYRTEGEYSFQGDSIHYRYMFKTNSDNDYVRSSQVYIDSLIAEALY